MKILIVSQYFWPESFIINDLVRTLRDQGHTITVATGKPNYPEGKIYDGYSATDVQKEIYDGNIEVFRVPLRPRGKTNALNLFLNYMSFVWHGLRRFSSLLSKHSFDSIIVFSLSPITMAIPAIALKWRKKTHLTLWIQDLWPESLAATGFTRNRILLKLVGLMVRAIYATADTILVQSEAFKTSVSHYSKKQKIIYYPNSLNISKNSSDEISPLPSELLTTLKNHFCVIFAGNIGTAQAVETLVDAALKLRELQEVRMVLVGSGTMLEWVKQKKKELNLNNLILAGRFPPTSMPEIYRHAGCLVVTLKDEEIFSYTIPCKVQSYLAAGKPIIAALNGEGARVVAEASAGLTCPAENSLALADCVKSLYLMPESERIKLGNAGKKYFLQHFEMGRQAERLIEILEQQIAEKERKSR